MSGRFRRILVLGLTALGLPALAAASDLRFHTVGIAGGLGTALDRDSSEIDNTVLQVSYSFATGDQSRVSARLGSYSFAREEVLNGFVDPRLVYATVTGEWRNRERVYNSGFYGGLGIYRLESSAGGHVAELGVTAGYNGEFEITRSMDLVLEFAGHYVDFPRDQAFAQAMIGLAWNF